VPQLRVVSLDGPGDVAGTFRRWLTGNEDPSVTHVAFSGQLFDACSELEAELLMLGEHPRRERIEGGAFVVENRGNDSLGKRGLAFHRAEIGHALRTLTEVQRYRPHAVITSMRPHPFLLRALRLGGARLIYNLHNVLWPKFASPTRVQRTLNRLNAPALREAAAVLCVSEDIKRQVRQITGGRCAPFVDFLPSFKGDLFEGIRPPDFDARPFRVMYAGRIEADKGVFALLEIARKLRDAGRSDIEFEICGDGSALPELRARAREQRLEETFLLRGWCQRPEMMECFGRAHVVLVPTTTAFVEGFNMVVIEALLAGRPVISSAVCPALEYVARGVHTVPPDAVDAYADAIAGLADDRAAYRRLQAGALVSARRFLDDALGFRRAIVHVLAAVAEGRPVEAREISPLAPVGGA
jgi:glycogen synthase